MSHWITTSGCIIATVIFSMAGCQRADTPADATSEKPPVSASKGTTPQSSIHPDPDHKVLIYQHQVPPVDGFSWNTLGEASLNEPLEIPDHGLELKVFSMSYEEQKVASAIELSARYEAICIQMNNALSEELLNQLCEKNPQLRIIEVNTDAEDLSCFAKLEELKELRLTRSRGSDYDWLEGMSQLEILVDRGAERLSNIEGLKFVPNLTKLDLGIANSVDSLKPIQNLRNLRELSLHGTGMRRVSELAFLDDLPLLETLTLEDIEVEFEVRAMPNLRRLCLEHLGGSQIPLDFPALEELRIVTCRNFNVGEAEFPTTLKKLELVEVPESQTFTNLQMLLPLQRLEVLKISGNLDWEGNGGITLEDVSALEQLPALRKVELSACSPDLSTIDLGKLEKAGVEISVTF